MTKKYKWLNENSRKFLSRGYLKDGQTPEERYKQIADHVEKLMGVPGWSDKFQDYLSRKFYSLSTPVITNFGNKRGLPVSCFGSYIPDDITDIFDRVGETGVMTKNGGGTSAYFGSLRPRGAKIKDNGESSGPVHFMQLFDKVSSVVSQGSSRRGAFAAYLPVEHPDIMEFLQIRDTGNPIQEMNFGVTITDKWMQDMVDGDKNNRKIWSKIIQKRFESGYPYIFFTDTVNNGSPQVYKDKELTINASNLCVVGDTMIEILINDIEKLKIKIEDLNFYLQKYKNTKVKSFDTTTNLTCFSEITDFAQTGESSDIIEIEDENGNIIKCTPEHKIYTKNRGYVEAQFLKSDDVLENLK